MNRDEQIKLVKKIQKIEAFVWLTMCAISMLVFYLLYSQWFTDHSIIVLVFSMFCGVLGVIFSFLSCNVPNDGIIR